MQGFWITNLLTIIALHINIEISTFKNSHLMHVKFVILDTNNSLLLIYINSLNFYELNSSTFLILSLMNAQFKILLVCPEKYALTSWAKLTKVLKVSVNDSMKFCLVRFLPANIIGSYIEYVFFNKLKVEIFYISITTDTKIFENLQFSALVLFHRN